MPRKHVSRRSGWAHVCSLLPRVCCLEMEKDRSRRRDAGGLGLYGAVIIPSSTVRIGEGGNQKDSIHQFRHRLRMYPKSPHYCSIPRWRLALSQLYQFLTTIACSEVIAIPLPIPTHSQGDISLPRRAPPSPPVPAIGDGPFNVHPISLDCWPADYEVTPFALSPLVATYTTARRRLSLRAVVQSDPLLR